ncbi:MAG: voltage-dependent potassium channel beta subunit [Chlamydiales bacterium]|jgi:voltage-dependent potassium channel beta subunit
MKGSAMLYKHLGKSGLKVSELSFGSWLTFGENLGIKEVKECIKAAMDEGVNFFDNAEVYAQGKSEELMGEALKEFRRENLVVSTKIFWGGEGPNDTGLSMKHIIEGAKNSLKRLQMDYVDLIYCHRPDPQTPLEETVRAMDLLVRQGLAFYWGTSEWSALQIEQAHMIARQIGAVPPLMEQPEYNMFKRDRVEQEYLILYEKFGMGTTIWSPLAQGLLTGKYNDGVPQGTRFEKNSWLKHTLTEEVISKVKDLCKIAYDLKCTMPQMALAWCLKNPHVSTVITGATSVEQIKENMESILVKDKLTPEVMSKIENILQNKPEVSLSK